jgi:hypothetical protein
MIRRSPLTNQQKQFCLFGNTCNWASCISGRASLVAFTFGLLHGLGFAGALAQVGLPDKAIPVALFLFNLGVEIGQLIFVFAILFITWLLRNYIKRAPYG